MIQIYVSFEYDGVLDFKSPIVGVHEEKGKKDNVCRQSLFFFVKL